MIGGMHGWRDDKKVSFITQEKAQGSNSLQSSSTGSGSAGTKTIYMPMKQEADGQKAEAIIVEDKKKAEARLTCRTSNLPM